MGRAPARTPQPRRRPLSLPLLSLGLALSACGPSAPAAPRSSQFTPSRPTPKGSLSDAVQNATTRSGHAVPKPATAPAPVHVAPRQEYQPEVGPRPELAATRLALNEYMARMSALLVELDRVLARSSTPGSADSVRDAVTLRVDEVRAALDQLVDMPAESRRRLEPELGAQLRSIAERLNSRLESLRTDPAAAPIVRLVADLSIVE